MSELSLDWNQAAFTAWLASKPRRSSAGYVNTMGACPLARWRASCGDPCVVEHEEALYCDWEERPVGERAIGRLPDWASTFARTVDLDLAPEAGPYERTVSAGAALWILRHLCVSADGDERA